MAHKHVLLVEGINDLHAVRNLVYAYDISVHYQKDEKGPSAGEADLEIQQAGGRSRLDQSIRDFLQLGDVRTLGVVLDADDDASGSWDSVLDSLFRHDEGSPTHATTGDLTDGFVGETLDSVGDPVQVGAWVMPNNESEGALEDFAIHLIPDQDALWPHAREVVRDLPEKRFKDSHTGKAELHTYLAWQNPPREPVGRSINAGPLKTNSNLAQRFVAWVRHLFPHL
jgi:hypothetical protein